MDAQAMQGVPGQPPVVQAVNVVPQQIQPQRQMMNVQAQPMQYTHGGLPAGNIAADDAQKSRMVWGMCLAGYCCLWFVSLVVPFASCLTCCLWPGGYIIYKMIPAQNRPQYKQTKRAAMANLFSCVVWICFFICFFADFLAIIASNPAALCPDLPPQIRKLEPWDEICKNFELISAELRRRNAGGVSSSPLVAQAVIDALVVILWSIFVKAIGWLAHIFRQVGNATKLLIV